MSKIFSLLITFVFCFSFSLNGWEAHRIAQDYILDSMIYPDAESFYCLLSPDVVLIRNVNNQLTVLSGRDEVFKLYKTEVFDGASDHLFDSLMNSLVGDLMVIDFFGEYLDANGQRVRMHEHTTLLLRVEADGKLLIAEIMTNLRRGYI